MSEPIVGLIIPLITLLFAGLFAVLWLREREARHILFLAVSYFLMAVGFAVQHYTTAPNSKATFLIMHALYSGSILALAVGVGGRAGTTVPLTAMWAAVLTTAAMLVVTDFTVNQNPRLYLTNSCYGLMMAMTALMLSRAAQKEMVDRVILALITLTAVQFYVRPYLTITLAGPLTTDQYQASPYYAALLVTVALLATSLAMALVGACMSDQLQRLKNETSRDHLTGLKLRKAFESDAMELLEKAQAENGKLSIIVADIDHFKRVNDEWGHQVGDTAIAAFGSLLKRTVRASDRIGRIGGEEFCIIVWQCDRDGAARLAERLRSAFERMPVDGQGSELMLTASFGVAEWQAGQGYGKLFARGDTALYAAKQGGRNRVCVAPGQAGPKGASVSDIETGRSAA